MKHFFYFLLPLMLLSPGEAFSQKKALEEFLSDSIMINATVSFTVRDAASGRIVYDYSGDKSLSQASVMKLITSAAALEMLGPEHVFHTVIGYTGHISRRGRLDGDIVITGGGDPALGSERFAAHYGNIIDTLADDISKLGIRRISGRVICDDSYFDFVPVPSKWLREDIGNYYGAGVYGLNLYDNTVKLHFSTSGEGSRPEFTGAEPDEGFMSFADSLISSGIEDNGYVYSEPYSYKGLIRGTIPSGRKDFVLKASMTDPPLAAACLLDRKLSELNIKAGLEPSTTRLDRIDLLKGFVKVSQVDSPPLSDILAVLNHESVNLYAEDLLKELGKTFGKKGSADEGARIVNMFLDSLGVCTAGLFIEDGCGLSPQDAVNSSALSDFLFRMKKGGRYFDVFYNSLPEPGGNGTLKTHFTDHIFGSALRAKSGSMLRVRSYAGYLTSLSGRNLTFSIIVNNYRGPSQPVISHIESILRETILEN